MSDYWDFDEYPFEPEPEIELENGAADLNIGLSINAGLIESSIQRHIDSILENRIKSMVEKRISHALKDLLKKDSWSDKSLEAMMNKAVEKRLNELYPETVENKVNEFEKAIRELQFGNRTNTQSLDRLLKNAESKVAELHKKAESKVEAYIENELSKSVAKSNEYIEQFAKNYFAQNLFRAMGMMDKMLPQTESMKDK